MELLLFQSFGHSYLFQMEPIWNMQGKYFIALKKIFQGCLHAPIEDHLTPILRGFVVRSQIVNLTPPNFLFIITHAFQV